MTKLMAARGARVAAGRGKSSRMVAVVGVVVPGGGCGGGVATGGIEQSEQAIHLPLGSPAAMARGDLDGDFMLGTKDGGLSIWQVEADEGRVGQGFLLGAGFSPASVQDCD